MLCAEPIYLRYPFKQMPFTMPASCQQTVTDPRFNSLSPQCRDDRSFVAGNSRINIHLIGASKQQDPVSVLHHYRTVQHPFSVIIVPFTAHRPSSCQKLNTIRHSTYLMPIRTPAHSFSYSLSRHSDPTLPKRDATPFSARLHNRFGLAISEDPWCFTV
jgi:hypothetical protein